MALQVMKTKRIIIPRGGGGLLRASEGREVTLSQVSFWGALRQNGSDVESAPYERHPWFYAAVQALARAITAVPFRIYKGERPKVRSSLAHLPRFLADRSRAQGDPVESGPWVDLFDSPCPALTRAMTWLATVVHMQSSGECFWIKLGTKGRYESGVPTELWPHSPKGWQPLDEQGQVGQSARTRMPVQWQVGNHKYPLREVVHFKLFNPSNMMRGLASITPSALALQSDHAAGEFNRQFFKRGCNPGGIFKSQKKLGEDQLKRYQAWVESQVEGLDNSERGLLLHDGMDFEWNPRSHKDAEFTELRRSARDEILVTVGVLKSILGVTDDLNYATALGQMRLFYRNTVIPWMIDLEDGLYSQLFRPGDGGQHWGAFDLSQVEALQDDLGAKATSARAFFDMGWSRDEVNERLGLGFTADPKTDIRGGPPPVDLGITLDEPAATDPATEPAQLEAVADGALNGGQISSLLEIATKVQAGELDPDTAKGIIAVGFPSVDAKEAAAIIDPAAKAAAEQKTQEPPAEVPPAQPGQDKVPAEPALPPEEEAPRAVREILETGRTGVELADLWHRAVNPPLAALLKRVMGRYFDRFDEALLAEFEQAVKDAAGELTAENVAQMFKQRARWEDELGRTMGPPIKDVQALSLRRLARELKAPAISVTNPAIVQLHARKLAILVQHVPTTHIEGMRSELLRGMAEGEGIDDMRLRLKEWTEGNSYRALRIARTESGMAQSSARYVGMQQSGISQHKWVSVLGEGTRESHRAEHGHVVAIGTPFPTTGLLHPRQMGAAAEEVINCDCDVLAIIEGL